MPHVVGDLQLISDINRSRIVISTNAGAKKMLRMIYASIALRKTKDVDIERIVSFSAMFNVDNDITGVLAFDGMRIVQILEGPDDVVSDLFGRIAADRRHEGVVELVNQRIDGHTLDRWGMVRRPISDVLLAVERLR